MTRKHLKPLTTLRFAAALMVVCHHYFDFEPGYVGVTFFFVLSGFILTYSHSGLSRASDSYAQFWLKRAARIYPTHLLTLAIAVPLTLYGLHKAGSSASDIAAQNTIPLLLNALLLQSWVPIKSVYFSFNAVSWSISTEMAFYAAFPFLLARFERQTNASLVRTVGAWGAVLIIIATIWSLLFPGASILSNPTHYVFYINPLTRIFEFSSGIVLGLWFLRSPEVTVQSNTTAREVIALVFAIATVGLISFQTLPSAFALSLVAVPASALIVAIFAQGNGAISHALSNPGAVLLGEASFALYMIHTLVKQYVSAVLWDGAPVEIISLVLSIGLSIVIFYSWEKPLQRYLLERYGSIRGGQHAAPS